MLHQFKVANNLGGKSDRELFIHPVDILKQELGSEDTLVFVDDMVGTGTQACEWWTKVFQELVVGIGRVYLIVVVAAEAGMKRVADETELVLVPGHRLGAGDNLFAAECPYFTETEKTVLLEYAKRASSKTPRGFGDAGLLLVFQHGCPNGSVPILHARKPKWRGLFPRHDA